MASKKFDVAISRVGLNLKAKYDFREEISTIQRNIEVAEHCIYTSMAVISLSLYKQVVGKCLGGNHV